MRRGVYYRPVKTAVVANRCYCSTNKWLFIFIVLSAVLFGGIWIDYVAYYSARIEYLVQP